MYDVALGTPAPQPRVPVVSNGVLGTLLFVVCETMLFAGFISAHTITRATAELGLWPPPGQPRLPVELTAFNTAALLLSGVALIVANRRFRAAPGAALKPLLATAALGLLFVALQGFEWVGLVGEGLTLTSSRYGSFFYLIVGMHAAHAVLSLVGLGLAASRLRRGTLTASFFGAVQVFWFFVVALWPVIYARVYF